MKQRQQIIPDKIKMEMSKYLKDVRIKELLLFTKIVVNPMKVNKINQMMSENRS
jgi:hypothetical protein